MVFRESEQHRIGFKSFMNTSGSLSRKIAVTAAVASCGAAIAVGSILAFSRLSRFTYFHRTPGFCLGFAWVLLFFCDRLFINYRLQLGFIIYSEYNGNSGQT